MKRCKHCHLTSLEVKWAKRKEDKPVGLVCRLCANKVQNAINIVPENRAKKNASTARNRATAAGKSKHRAASSLSQSQRLADPAKRAAHNARSVTYKQQQLASNDSYRFRHGVRTLIRSAFKGLGYTKASKTSELLGCTFEKLQKWLGLDGAVPLGYEIDHILPVSLARNIEDFCTLQHYTNLQLLSSADNLIKSNFLPDGRRATELSNIEAIGLISTFKLTLSAL